MGGPLTTGVGRRSPSENIDRDRGIQDDNVNRSSISRLSALVYGGLAAVIILGFGQQSAHTQDFGPAYFTTKPTFGVESTLGTIKRRIVSALPIRTLIFHDPTTRRVNIRNREYYPVITQHGVRVLLLPDVISKDPFNKVYSDQHNVIFHADTYLCPNDPIKCDDLNQISVHPGDVFGIDPLKDGHINFRGRSQLYNESVSGRRSEVAFTRMKSKGMLSDTNDRYPPYLVTATDEFKALNTDCGQIKEFIDYKALKGELKAAVEPTALLAQISKIFQLRAEVTATMERSGKLTSNYGEKDTAIKFFRISVKVYDPEWKKYSGKDTRIFYMAEKLACLGAGITGSPIYMKEISIKEDDDEPRLVIAFRQLYPNLMEIQEYNNRISPQFQVFRLNGGFPFMTSINSIRSYERLIVEIEQQTHDLSIAAIFSSLFNASCPDGDVGGENARTKCERLLEASTPATLEIPD